MVNIEHWCVESKDFRAASSSSYSGEDVSRKKESSSGVSEYYYNLAEEEIVLPGITGMQDSFYSFIYFAYAQTLILLIYIEILFAQVGHQIICFNVLQTPGERGKGDEIFLGQCCLKYNHYWNSGGSFSMPLKFLDYSPAPSYDSFGRLMKLDASYFVNMIENVVEVQFCAKPISI